MKFQPRAALVVSVLCALWACSPSVPDNDGPGDTDIQSVDSANVDDSSNPASDEAGTADNEKDRHSIVIGRVGAVPEVKLGRPDPVKLLKLGGEIRRAFRVEPGAPLRVSVNGTARRVLLSVGVRGIVIDPPPIQFVVRAKTPDGWKQVLSETVDSVLNWRDYAIDQAQIPSGATEFEFETAFSEPNDELTAHFGSVIFSGLPPDERADRPNVVLMSLDTLGAAYLGSRSDFVGVSPTLDAILRRSGSFSQAVAQFGSTLQSHMSLFASRYPSSKTHDSIVGHFANHGYLTLAVTEGGFVSSSYGLAQGFDWYDNGPIGKKMGTAGAERTFGEAADTLQRLESFAPIFAFVHTYEVHNPYSPQSEGGKTIASRLSPGDDRPYDELSPHAEDPVDRRRLWALYVGGVHDLDQQIARFFDRLESLDRASDTLVVVTADHGEGFFHRRVGHGGLHNDVLRVPLGFHWPGRIPARRTDSPVELVDVMPTILELAEIPQIGGLDGRSLVSLLNSAEVDPKRLQKGAFSRSSKEGDAIQTRRFKFVRNPRTDFEALYDLRSDISETDDVSQRNPVVTRRLRAKLEARTGSLDDPPDLPSEGDGLDPETHERLRALGYLE